MRTTVASEKLAIAHLYSVETDRRPAKPDLRRARSFLPTSGGRWQKVPHGSGFGKFEGNPGGRCLLALAGFAPRGCQLLPRTSRVKSPSTAHLAKAKRSDMEKLGDDFSPRRASVAAAGVRQPCHGSLGWAQICDAMSATETTSVLMLLGHNMTKSSEDAFVDKPFMPREPSAKAIV